MSTSSADYKDVIDHLPGGATLVFEDVAWDEYEQLLEALADRPGLRLTYDSGRLQIISPSRKHEKYKEIIGDLIKAVVDELGITAESSGSTTWKRKEDAKG